MPATQLQLVQARLPGIIDEAGTVQGSQDVMNLLSPRDGLVVRLVGEFHQATASQIKEVLFAYVSRVSLERSLKRLCAQKYLSRLQRRHAGEKGGSGAYVYQLGPRGWWWLDKRGNYRPAQAINYHALAVADIFTLLVQTERIGLIHLLSCRLELVVGYARADMCLEIGVKALDVRRIVCIEVEVTRKRPSYIQEKCDAYSRAWNTSKDTVFPYVVFVAPDPWIKSEISKVTNRHKDKELFKVCEPKELVLQLTS